MKIGEVYERPSGVIYIVVMDYGTLRPLRLHDPTDAGNRFVLRMNRAFHICKDDDISKPFYSGDKLIANSMEEYLGLLIEKELLK